MNIDRFFKMFEDPDDAVEWARMVTNEMTVWHARNVTRRNHKLEEFPISRR